MSAAQYGLGQARGLVTGIAKGRTQGGIVGVVVGLVVGGAAVGGVAKWRQAKAPKGRPSEQPGAPSDVGPSDHDGPQPSN